MMAASRWHLSGFPEQGLTEARCLDLIRAVLQRFRSDGTDRMDAFEVSKVGTESITVVTRRIGGERSGVELQRLTVRAGDGGEQIDQVNFRVVGLEGGATLRWEVGSLARPGIRLEGGRGFAREVAALFRRTFGEEAELTEVAGDE